MKAIFPARATRAVCCTPLAGRFFNSVAVLELRAGTVNRPCHRTVHFLRFERQGRRFYSSAQQKSPRELISFLRTPIYSGNREERRRFACTFASIATS